MCLATGWLAAAAGDGEWRWPVTPVHILRGFEAPDGPYGPGHRGVDLAATRGQLVVAPGAGVVSYAGVVAGVPLVVVRHGDLRSTLQPVSALVAVGQPVQEGQPIGTVAAGPAHCLQTCLHWGVLHGADYLDPAGLVGGSHPRLLPYWKIPPPRPGADPSGTAAAAASTSVEDRFASSGPRGAPTATVEPLAPAPPSRGERWPLRLAGLTLSAVAVGVGGWRALGVIRARR